MSERKQNTTNLEKGRQTILGAAKNLPQSPGVYRMLDDKGNVLYVGKAKALKRRVSSYTQISRLSHRLLKMVSLTRMMEFVETQTESEALLLEANLIKQLKPRFNILLRDDKSFPYILLREDHDYPMVVKYRGKKNKDGRYYGPFASAGDVMRTLKSIQRVFMLRNCSDNNFAGRTRPCLQYHIKRCTAPCVGKVSRAEYTAQVKEAQDFLEGKSRQLQENYQTKMQQASADMDYEEAARYRDRFKALQHVHAYQDINLDGLGDADVIALYQEDGRCCVQVFFFRAGQNYGNWASYPKYEEDPLSAEIMGSFLSQFYLNKPVPKEIIVSHRPESMDQLQNHLSEMAEKKIQITIPQRGHKKVAIEFATRNAQAALKRKMAQNQSDIKALNDLAKLLDMEEAPKRIEAYDNSHISGTNMVGAMIVAGPEGFEKKSYRKFNIRESGAGDDYAMMREVMTRRFRKSTQGDWGPGAPDWPDLLLIDGGKGQLSCVMEILEEYGIADALTVLAIAKGEDRNAGREQFFMPSGRSFTLSVNDPVLFYLQRIRDEVHRYVIGSHRKKREKEIQNSPLDGIAGVGAKKKSALISYFGSAKSVSQARVEDLQKVSGVSKKLAQVIYDYFHENN